MDAQHYKKLSPKKQVSKLCLDKSNNSQLK